MKPKPSLRIAGYLYLILVPVFASALGFGVGKISAFYYLPIWILNAGVMIMAARNLGQPSFFKNSEKKFLIAGAFFLLVPWILISMFFGLGPPPESPSEWTATAAEQQIRYFMLTIAGVFIALGFSFLRENLKQEGEKFFSLLGFILILIAIPLFVLDMLFWGFSLTESFKILVSSHTEKLPEWFAPMRKLFGMISVVEVALTYLATAFFAVSMHRTGWLGILTCRIYIAISLVAFILIVLSSFFSEPFLTAGFVVSIPAAPFLMPYYMGVNLLYRTRKIPEN